MKNIKKLLSRLSVQAGAGILVAFVITWGTVYTLVGLGLAVKGMYDFYKWGEVKTEESKEKFTPKSNDQWDEIEALQRLHEEFPKLYGDGVKQGTKQVAGSWDSTGISQTLDYNGKETKTGEKTTAEETYDVKEESFDEDYYKRIKEKGLSSEEIIDLLKENNLNSDRLSRDMVKSVSNIAVENSKDSADPETVKEAIAEVIRPIIERGSEEPDPSRTSDEVEDKIKEKLSQKKILEDQKIIDMRKKLNRMLNCKNFIAEKIAEYEKLEEQGYRMESTGELENLKQRIDELDNEIADMNDELDSYEDKTPEQETTIAEETVIETTEQTSGQTTEETTEQTEEITADTTEETTEDTIEQTTQETKEEQGGTITLTGQRPDGIGGITMKINLDTGKVSGSVWMQDTVQVKHQTRDNQTGEVVSEEWVTCNANVNASISGSMDLMSKYISANVSGTVNYSGESPACNNVQSESMSEKWTGKLSEDNNSASGTTNHGNSWSVTR